MKNLFYLTVLACLATASNAETVTVCSSGCDYTSVNDAIDASSSGDVIQLSAEIYTEGTETPLRGTAQQRPRSRRTNRRLSTL